MLLYTLASSIKQIEFPGEKRQVINYLFYSIYPICAQSNAAAKRNTVQIGHAGRQVTGTCDTQILNWDWFSIGHWMEMNGPKYQTAILLFNIMFKQWEFMNCDMWLISN